MTSSSDSASSAAVGSEDEDGIVADQRAGDADALALAAGQGSAAVADHGVVAVGHAADEFVGVGQLGCPKDLFFGGIGSTEGDVVGHGAAQQHGFLQHESDLGTQTVQLEVADVDTVDAEAPGVGVSESRDHAQHG